MFILLPLLLLPLDGHRIEAFRAREHKPLVHAVQSLDGHRATAVARAATAPVRAFRNRERTPVVSGVKALGRGLASLRPRGCRGGR